MKPTKAVSATRNTLSASTKNCSSQAVIGPPEITIAVSQTEATKVAKLSAELTSGATLRSPKQPQERAAQERNGEQDEEDCIVSPARSSTTISLP